MLRTFVRGATHHFVDSQILLKIANAKAPFGLSAIFLTQKLTLLMQCSRKCVTSVSKIVTVFLFCIVELYAAKWKYQYQFVLKKDQVAKVKISYRDKKVFLRDGIFTFRWTLYKNRELSTFSSYQKVKSQHVMTKDFRLNSFKVELVPMGNGLDSRIYLLVVFESFDKKNKTATIDMFIKDDNVKILADFINPNNKGINVK